MKQEPIPIDRHPSAARTPSATLVASDRLEELLRQIAMQDRSAFEELYRRTSAKLFAACLRILRDRQMAEDALQTACLSIWRNASSYDPARGAPMTWLITTARNRAVDRLRANRSMANAPIEAVTEVRDPAPLASELVEAAGEARRLAECMDDLDAADAAFIRTAFFEGSTYVELAVRAGMPLGTIKSRIRRALLKLRDCLQ